MPESLEKTDDQQIIAGAFTDKTSATSAVEEFSKLGYFGKDIKMVNDERPQVGTAPNATLTEEGLVQGMSVYYSKAVEAGKTVVIVYNVTDPAPVIDIFNRFGADYNPDGSRALRDDVAGMTLGAAAGAIALGAAGGVVAGPVGLALGASAGAVMGGVTGGAIGTSAEHKK